MNDTIVYAKMELKKYLNIMTGKEDFNIELYVDRGCMEENSCRGLNENWDDAFVVEVVNGYGKICGINSRSVLLGVYDLLNKLGCRFFRPTAEGEFIPRVSLKEISLKYSSKASYRHRGICLEGAVSLDNVLDIIEWAPKVGFNSYFIQFRDGHTFFERWYTHEDNELLDKQAYCRADSARYTEIIINEIKRRDMLLHAVGHGWTCEALGFESTGWNIVKDSEVSEDHRRLLAMVNGKRGFYKGIPLNTQLCYSNPEARKRIIDEILNYILSHREVDVLHFWLGDNYNNFCECSECRGTIPTDFYVKMLNELDIRLSELNLGTKIVFLIYYELMWTPEHEKMINQDRFIMMFAPITRTFTRTYLSGGKAPESKRVRRIPYDYNRVQYPSDIEANLAFLYEWQRIYKGDSFDFDYHLMWDIYKEYSNIRLAKVIYEDIRGLQSIGLNGLMSCQVQRAFFPSGICMYIMGRTLFNNALSFDYLLQEYFGAAYGEHASLALEYLEGISKYFAHEYMRNEVAMINSEMADSLEDGVKFIDSILPRLLQAEEHAGDLNQRTMIKLLIISCKIYRRLGVILKAKAIGSPVDDLKGQWEGLRMYICSIENEVQPVLDVKFFNLITGGIILSEW